MNVLRRGLPTRIAGAGAVVLHRALGERHGREGEADADMVARRELPGLGAGAGHVKGRVRLLHRARPDRDRAVLVIAAEPPERPRLGPGATDQMKRLGKTVARFRRVNVVGHVFVRRAAHHAGNQSAAGHCVEHRELFRNPYRVQDRQGRAQDRNPGAADKLAQRSRHHHRVWGEREARIMVLGNRHPVKADSSAQRNWSKVVCIDRTAASQE